MPGINPTESRSTPAVRLAIFGGTFDPIHNAHLAIATAAADRFRLDRVLFVPADRPPHKAGVTHASYEDRFRMAELACAGEPRFEVSRLEEGTQRSYSIETIEKLRVRVAPQDKLFFIIGADAFAELQTWLRWRDVAAAVRFLVISRPGHVYHAPAGVAMERLDTVELRISSSQIRAELAAGRKPSGVPQPVLDYIFEHALYGARVPA
jgi:nicotinate-nucleotide adenylyltransferase